VNESLRFSDGESNKPVDRHQFFLVQTPQIFRVEAIRNAYQQPFSEKYTDDAMVLENTGVNIHLIPGETRNLKITVAEDLLIAEALIKNEPH
jgi:2-C-methyl-D-erythritol 4-phosphate cytidylyltransferase